MSEDDIKLALVGMARMLYCMDTPDIQVDTDAEVALSDNPDEPGGWVAAWVWVPIPEDEQEN